MSDDQIRILQIAVAEHKIRIDTMEKLLKSQNESLAKVSEQLGKLESRLTSIGYAGIAVIALASDTGGAVLRSAFSLIAGGA